MLLVDHDQPEPLDRSEHGRARTHAHARLPDPQTTPLLASLCDGEARVEHRDRVAEALGETGDDLRRERDLRDKHDRAPTLLQRLGGDPQVHLGLARAR